MQIHYIIIIGIWSKSLLPLLRESTQTLEETLKLVHRIVKEQSAPYTNNGVPDVCWVRKVQEGEGNLQSSPPALPVAFFELSAKMRDYRERKLISTHMKCSCLSLTLIILTVYLAQKSGSRAVIEEWMHIAAATQKTWWLR